MYSLLIPSMVDTVTRRQSNRKLKLRNSGKGPGLFQTKTRRVKNNAPTTIMPFWTPKRDSVEVKSKAGAQDHATAALVPVTYALTDEITVGVTASLRICAGVRLTLAASRCKTLHSSMYYFPFDNFFGRETRLISRPSRLQDYKLKGKLHIVIFLELILHQVARILREIAGKILVAARLPAA
jgi:hypothetical protein